MTPQEALAAVTAFIEGSESLQKPSTLASELELLGPKRAGRPWCPCGWWREAMKLLRDIKEHGLGVEDPVSYFKVP